MKKKHLTLLMSSMLALIIALAACTPTQTAPPEQPAPQEQTQAEPAPPGDTTPDPSAAGGGGLTVLVPSLAISMDPPQSNDSASAEFARLAYSTLFRQDYDTFEVTPELAVNWEMSDAQTLNIEIRRDVYFHNGTQLTAHDVAFSLTRAGDIPNAAPILGMIDFAEATDDFNLTVHLEMPFSPIIAHLAHPAASIVPMDLVLSMGDDAFAQDPVGSGAFVFVEHVIGDRIEFVRNENYFGAVPMLETLTFRNVPDPSTRLIEVTSGTADIALNITPADVPVAEADPNSNVVSRLTMGTDFIWMNTRQPYLNNPLVRQAISLALDTSAIRDLVWMGLGGPQYGHPVPPGAFGYWPAPPTRPDLDAARALLAEAGYADGFSTSIWWNSPNTLRQQVAEMVQFSLAQIGIDVSIQTLEWGAYLEGADRGDHEMMIIGWTTVTGDADYALFPLLHSSSYGAPGNRAFWSTPELDALLERGRAETDPAVRMEIYAEAQQIIAEAAPLIILRQGEIANAVSPRVQGFVPSPTLSHNYAPVWLD
ncbi:MAG: ABC transporter substrate-binding protein [Defluviitaleaceae bacterium]|nr:ABC transporter substrate-binding protein [Defluviitaleaceae bacterium]